MNELAGQSLGGYLLEEELGRGSMGMVYRGKQVALGREVAVKILPQSLAKNPSYVARFIREAQIIAGLNHPNIVQIYDAGQQNGVLYFVMEYVQGPTISSLLHMDGSMPQHLAATYIAQIANALDAAYQERNVIHRNIKPENLMLDRWGRIKVMDFGLARAPGLQQITVVKTLVGSIYYASPEQIWGKPLDNRSNIYALGVVLYEMVTGQRPFSGRTLQEVTQLITHGRFLPPTALNPVLSPELEQIILTAMAADRDERFAQANLMAEELRALQLSASPARSVHTSEIHPSVGSNKAHGPQFKGPQEQPRHYSTIDALQTFPPHERSMASPIHIEETRPQVSPPASEYDTSPEHPAQTYSGEQEEQFVPTAELPASAFSAQEHESPSQVGRKHHWRQTHRRSKSS